MSDQEQLDWKSEFTDDELQVLRSALPQAVHACQDRSARAHTEYADPDGHQYIYGNGMARGVPKDLQPLLKDLSSYREESVSGTRRTLMFVGEALVFPMRVGKKMPRNHRRIRLNYLPDGRRELLRSTSNTKYRDEGLFDLPAAHTPDDDIAQLSDVVRMLRDFTGPVTLFPAYYSSTPFSVGTIFWGPARLSGNYLEFTDPERLTYQKIPAAAQPEQHKPRPAGGFADGERPRTQARLRPRPEDQKGSS